MSQVEPESPPVGEEIHLPGPSLIPFVNAIGITLIVVGTTTSVVFLVLGLILFVISTFRWIRDTGRDVAALPEDHGH